MILTWAAAAVLSALQGQVPRGFPRFTSTTELVRLDVLAHHGGAPLRGLAADDFEVRDNGVPQEFRLIPADHFPWELLVVLDTSESVKGPKLESFRATGRAIAGALRKDDRAGLVTFSHAIRLRCPLTGEGATLLRTLDEVQADGSAALFDAVFTAMAISSTSRGRPLILLFSDGRDNVSWLSAEEVVAAARLSEAAIYAVSTSSLGSAARSVVSPPTWTSVASGTDDDFLGRITDATGGRLLRAHSSAELQRQVATVLDEVTARYLIGYEPKGLQRGGWHKVEVRLRRARGAIVVRPGYFGSASRVSDR